MSADRDNLPEAAPQNPAGESKPQRPADPASPGLQAAAARPQPPAIPRRYPKPPAFPRRLLMMCIRPEEWAESARYPLWKTLMLALLAILLGAGFFGAGTVQRGLAAARAFAASYDKSHPALFVDSEGILSTTQPANATQPAREPLTIPLGHDRGALSIVVDPSGKTKLEDIKTDSAALVTDKTIALRLHTMIHQATIKETFAEDLPPKGQTVTLDGAWLSHVIDIWGWRCGTLLIVFLLAVKTLSNGLWVLLMMFFCAPLVMAGAGAGRRGLAIPKRVAYRISAAVTIPLIMFEGLSEGLGYSLNDLVDPQFVLLFWILAASALAFWAGNLARTIFGPPPERQRAN